MKPLILILPLVITFALAAESANANSYTFTPLGTAGGSYSDANSINESGLIVGGSAKEGDTQYRATLWTNGNITGFSRLGGDFSVARSINDLGQVAGYTTVYEESTLTRATVWSNGSIIDLGTLSDYYGYSQATDINNFGQVVGHSNYDRDPLYSSVQRSTLWSNGNIVDLGALPGTRNSYAYSVNDTGIAVGISEVLLDGEGTVRATLWSNGNVTDLGTLGGNSSYALSVNSSGQVVGYSAVAGDPGSSATIWNNGIISDLGGLGEGSSQAFSINDAGQVVGYSFYLSEDSTTFIYAATLWSGGNIINLNSLLSENDKNSGWKLNYATDINESGWIIGSASNSVLGITSQAFLLAPTVAVPEADTSIMLLIGLGFIGLMTRPHRRHV